MESIAELRQICQTTAKKDVSNVYMRYVSRFFSIYLTRLLIPTPITPNQVSFAMIVTGVVASLMLVDSSRVNFLIAALLLQFWYILDCSDGELARYRQFQKKAEIVTDKRNSPMAGSYYDMMNHYIINFLVPLMLGYGLSLQSEVPLFLHVGMAGALGQVLMLAMHDGRSRALIAQVKKFEAVRIRKPMAQQGEKKQRSLFHVAFMVLHYLMTYPTVMNLILVTAVLNVIFIDYDFRVLTLFLITAGTAVVTTVFITRTISRKTIEEEFTSTFEPISS